LPNFLEDVFSWDDAGVSELGKQQKNHCIEKEVDDNCDEKPVQLLPHIGCGQGEETAADNNYHEPGE
jgi:hypothetical protein